MGNSQVCASAQQGQAGVPVLVAGTTIKTRFFAEWLSYIHEKGILHWDLKLQNVMIGLDG